jgi:hypothetical protein
MAYFHQQRILRQQRPHLIYGTTEIISRKKYKRVNGIISTKTPLQRNSTIGYKQSGNKETPLL